MKALEIIERMEFELLKSEPDFTTVIGLLTSLKNMIAVCKECGSEIVKKKSDQVFCSEKCSNRYRQRVFRNKALYNVKAVL